MIYVKDDNVFFRYKDASIVRSGFVRWSIDYSFGTLYSVISGGIEYELDAEDIIGLDNVAN